MSAHREESSTRHSVAHSGSSRRACCSYRWSGLRSRPGHHCRLSGGESKLLYEMRGRFSTPKSVADFDAGGDVDDERETAVVAQEPRLAADADKAFDLRGIWDRRPYGSQPSGRVCAECSDRNPIREQSRSLGCHRRSSCCSRPFLPIFPMISSTLKAAFVWLFRQVNDMASPCLPQAAGNAFMSSAAKNDREGNQHDKREGYYYAHCCSAGRRTAPSRQLDQLLQKLDLETTTIPTNSAPSTKTGSYSSLHEATAPFPQELSGAHVMRPRRPNKGQDTSLSALSS